MAAGLAGTLGAGLLYEAGGYDPIFALLAVLVALSMVTVWLFVDPDTSTVRGFAFKDLALNRRIRVMASFRAPYAFAVTLVRNWVPIYVGVSLANGGLGYRALVVGLVVAADSIREPAGRCPRTSGTRRHSSPRPSASTGIRPGGTAYCGRIATNPAIEASRSGSIPGRPFPRFRFFLLTIGPNAR